MRSVLSRLEDLKSEIDVSSVVSDIMSRLDSQVTTEKVENQMKAATEKLVNHETLAAFLKESESKHATLVEQVGKTQSDIKVSCEDTMVRKGLHRLDQCSCRCY